MRARSFAPSAFGLSRQTVRSPLEIGCNALHGDQWQQYPKGNRAGRTRPLGERISRWSWSAARSRNKLSEDFLVDMHVAWLEHGPEVINRLIAERPEVFLLAMLKIAQVHRVEVGRPDDFDRPSSKEEALRRLEQSAGPKARKMLEDFLAKVAKLEADQEAG